MPDRIRTEALDWQDLRYFVALARHGSLSATARAMRVNHATVARRLASLEEALNRTLFDRRQDGYALTSEGQAVLEHARTMEDAALGILHRSDAGPTLSGPVRLTTTRTLADCFLVRRLGGLQERYPGIDLEIIAELRVMSLARREADIALRLGRPSDSELKSRKLGRLTSSFYAAPSYASDLDGAASPVLISYDRDSDFVPEAAWLAQRFPTARFSFRSNSLAAQAEAARAGLGIALLPNYLAAADPGLRRLDWGQAPPAREVWLLTRPDLARVPRVRAVTDYLTALFRTEQPWS